jgi:hypothetical protein
VTRPRRWGSSTANIPVLGDAELVLGLDMDADRSRVLARGGLEEAEVANQARQILEGGDRAFRPVIADTLRPNGLRKLEGVRRPCSP